MHVTTCTHSRQNVPEDSYETNSKHVTMRMFYAYRVHERPGSCNGLLRGGRLFQEYVVDVFAKTENQRLQFLRHNQKKLRADVYKNLQTAVTQGDSTKVIGTRVILPSSFTAGPRYMNQLYQDAMALTRVHGKPDLFITFTCNPTWPEIMTAMLPGQQAIDRPDLVARVYHLKLRALMDDLVQQGVLGKVKAHVYTVEWQKRGLPHAHILLIFAAASKMRTPDDYDDVICAELPDPVKEKALFDIVSKHMMHGPCGKAALEPAACQDKDGYCKKHYPKPLRSDTADTEDGYPLYRRRDQDRSVIKKGTKLDNQWVVPHNRALCLKYNAHINVECCVSIAAIKYVHKYVYKGPDRAQATLQAPVPAASATTTANETPAVDEIQQYQEGRYIGASEAMWRTYGFEIHKEFPACVRLDVHLPEEQSVCFEEDCSPAMLQHMEPPQTKLLAFFEKCQADQVARTLRYLDFPSKFVWDDKGRRWTTRVNKNGTVGRMHHCHPGQGERYFLRLLLNHVVGPRCYEDVRTVDGQVRKKHKQA